MREHEQEHEQEPTYDRDDTMDYIHRLRKREFAHTMRRINGDDEYQCRYHNGRGCASARPCPLSKDNWRREGGNEDDIVSCMIDATRVPLTHEQLRFLAEGYVKWQRQEEAKERQHQEELDAIVRGDDDDDYDDDDEDYEDDDDEE